MDTSPRVVTRGWLDILIGAVLIAVALVALSFPVYLDSYDKWGIQVRCGNGYYTQLLQATIADQEQAHQSGPATDYVNQCKSALLHRRAWILPVAGLGAVILILESGAWMLRGSRGSSEPSSFEPTSEWLADPEEEWHEAALLDRRYRSHRPPSHDTTL